jgi:hypothetical protein
MNIFWVIFEVSGADLYMDRERINITKRTDTVLKYIIANATRFVSGPILKEF